ncbi:DUF1292 domain-containing protein [Qingrenia yutianensis]|uniref:UPF0473 protein H8706_03935 n=1 Tax=Qingrenia yutianensis TaxID=2763676 RepID=A0A926FC72_9FIRM|nr:DUF1292 domain-containing protein [Qingrenia yutianensis]MBC8596017.1 DUF1292 domain-containing protein [Qingrenia yutianensis]
MSEFNFNENKERNIIPFEDENGNKVNFEVIDAFKMDGSEYVALLPADDDDYDTEVFIMRIEKEGEDDVLVYIENDEELDDAFEMFKDRMGDEYDFLD